MLIEVAKALNQRDWDGVLNVTPDFFVTPGDYEAVDIPENMEACVPQHLLDEFRAKGWLD